MKAADDARLAAEKAARHSYGRLLAYLTARAGAIHAGEDALSEALARALAHWAETGVPDNPDAWLITVARRIISHDERRRKTADGSAADIGLLMDEMTAMAEDRTAEPFPDRRLALMFVCAHPAIDAKARTPLMLQSVLGLSVDRLAPAFLAAPATLSQRLVRAKRKISAASIPFSVPERAEWPARIAFVLDAIYAAYGIGWDGIDGGSQSAVETLCDEAIWLADVLVALIPDEPEALSLLAVLLYAQSRRRARRSASGDYVPLDAQPTTEWDPAMIARADRLLAQASAGGTFGRYQCEAAIQAVHAARARSGQTDWPALAALHAARCRLAPSVGAVVSHAAVVGRVKGPEAGLTLLDGIDGALTASYQPYWAVRAHLLADAGTRIEADQAYGLAIGLAGSDAVKRFLALRQAEVRNGTDPVSSAKSA